MHRRYDIGNPHRQHKAEKAVMTADPIKATIEGWERTGGLGVVYELADGTKIAREIGSEDWPILERLKYASRLFFARPELGERYRQKRETETS
jgi:hypothetical protein